MMGEIDSGLYRKPKARHTLQVNCEVRATVYINDYNLPPLAQRSMCVPIGCIPTSYPASGPELSSHICFTLVPKLMLHLLLQERVLRPVETATETCCLELMPIFIGQSNDVF